MVERDLQGGIAAHRQADEMRALDSKMVECGDAIAHHMQIGIGLRIGRHVGRRIAARGISDAAMALAEFAHLRLPAAMVGSEFVHEQDRRARSGFLVIQLHVVGRRCVRH
jgi:hypothetical protein